MEKFNIKEIAKRIESLKPDAMGKLTGGFAEVPALPSGAGMENGSCSGNKKCENNVGCGSNKECGNNKECQNNESCFNHSECVKPPKGDDEQKKDI